MRAGGLDSANRGRADDRQECGADSGGSPEAGQGLQAAADHLLLLRTRGSRTHGACAGVTESPFLRRNYTYITFYIITVSTLHRPFTLNLPLLFP